MAQGTLARAPMIEVELPVPGRRRSVWQEFARNRLAIVGLIVFIVLIGGAVAAPLLTSYDPNAVTYKFLAPPSREHWLGTDDVGRDVLSRLIYASRISATVGVSVSLVTVCLGTLVGAIAGYYGGRLDAFICGAVNLLLSIPLIPLAMVLGAFLKKDLQFIIMILGLLSWPEFARIIRAEFLSLKEREFTLAARLVGASDWRIILQHILPNTVGPMIVAATLGVASAILAESALSYLGYGIQPPTASWGNMLINAQRFFRTYPALAIYPGALISLTVVSINFIGDGLRDALDPRLRTIG